jgi:hypothetical protein
MQLFTIQMEKLSELQGHLQSQKTYRQGKMQHLTCPCTLLEYPKRIATSLQLPGVKANDSNYQVLCCDLVD